MRKPIDVSIPFVASIGAPGIVRVQLERAPSRNAILSIEVGYPQFSKGALASLTAADARQLVDGLMDCVHAMERDERLMSREDHG